MANPADAPILSTIGELGPIQFAPLLIELERRVGNNFTDVGNLQRRLKKMRLLGTIRYCNKVPQGWTKL